MEINLPVKLPRKINKGYPLKRNKYKNYIDAPWNWLTVFRAIDKLKKRGIKSYIKSVAKKYNINEASLRVKYKQWVTDGKPNKCIIKDNRGFFSKAFTEEEERELYEYIKELFIVNNWFIDDECIQIMAKKKWDILYPDYKDIFVASNGWVYDFKKRWRLSTRTSNPSRIATNINADRLNDFYTIYKDAKKRIRDEFIFNMDETFWRIINGSFKVIGLIGTENRKVCINVNPKEGFTTVLLISASGEFLTPTIILKGKTKRCLKKTGLIDDSMIVRKFNNSGWIDNDIMIFVLNKIYSKSNGNNALLILDEFSVHLNDIVKEIAKKLNIKLLYVPPGKTSTNQPLDVSINGALKSIGKRLEKEIFLSNPLGAPTIAAAIKCLIEAKKSITKEIIINAFTRACIKS